MMVSGHVWRATVCEVTGGALIFSIERYAADLGKLTARVHGCPAAGRVRYEDFMKVVNTPVSERYRLEGWASSEEDAHALIRKMAADLKDWVAKELERAECLAGQLDEEIYASIELKDEGIRKVPSLKL